MLREFLKYAALPIVIMAVFGLFLWNALWGGVVLLWGPSVMELLTYKNIMLVLLVWTLGIGIGFFWKKRKGFTYKT